jgi:pimeloyl-ACP methyl ester carboxylesterase
VTGVIAHILVKVVSRATGQLNSIPNHEADLRRRGHRSPSFVAGRQPPSGHATLVVLPGVGHMVPLQAPEALTRAIDEAMA